MIFTENYTRIIKEYPQLSFRHTKGKIDIFYNKQFHPHYEIYLFLNGHTEFLSEHTRKALNPYELIVIPPSKYHCFLTDDNFTDIYERCILNISTDFLNDEILKNALDNKELLKLNPNHRIVQNFMYLKEYSKKYSEKEFEYILSAVAIDIIFLIKQTVASSEGKTFGTLHPISIQIMDYINENYKSNITVSDIANNFSFSVSSVSHIFKTDFGISIKKYITEKRMTDIYTLLQKGEKPCVVSNTFGFSNYSTFYRSFRNHFGKSPFQIKKNDSV